MLQIKTRAGLNFTGRYRYLQKQYPVYLNSIFKRSTCVYIAKICLLQYNFIIFL